VGKRLIPIVIIALLLIIETTCSAQADSLYTITFHNKSDKTMEYTLYKLKRFKVKYTDEIEDTVKGKLPPDTLDVVSMPVGAYYIAWFNEGEAPLIDGTRFSHYCNTTFIFK